MKKVPFPLISPLIKTEFSFKIVAHFGHDRERERRSEIDSPCLVVREVTKKVSAIERTLEEGDCTLG